MEFYELLEEIQRFIPAEYAGISHRIGLMLPYLFLGINLLVCFFGHKLHKVWTAFLFFCIGFLAGAFSGLLFPAQTDIRIFIAIGLVLGVLAASLSHRLFRIQLFVLNAYLVYTALPKFFKRIMPGWAAVLLGLFAAAVAGVLAVKYRYLVTIITTSVSGACNAATAFWAMFSIGALLPVLFTALVLTGGGLALQFYLEASKRKSPPGKRREHSARQPAV